MSEPIQPTGTDPKPGGAPAAPAPKAPEIDLSKLTADQLTKVLENDELWKTPRLAALVESNKELQKLKTQQSKQTEEQLEEQKKFQELAEKRGQELAAANDRIKNLQIDQALTNKLVGQNVVDLDGALKLIDRSKITVGEDGTVGGVDDTLASLKTDRAYLFGTEGAAPQPKVGSPSNPTGAAPTPGQFTFKESQLTPAFFAEHQAEIETAARQGLIEPDGPPPQM